MLPGKLDATTAPSLSGEPRVDRTLTGDPGTWSPSPDTVKYQWLADGDPVDGATDLELRPVRRGRRQGDVAPGHRQARRLHAGHGHHLLDRPGRPWPARRLGHAVRRGRHEARRGAPPRRAGRQSRRHPVVQWTRDGHPIDGATTASYELTNADLGHRVRARVQWVRDGYTTLVLWSPRPHLVRTVPTVDVDLEKGDGRLTFTTTATAKGLDAVPALVRIRQSGDVLAEKNLRDGRLCSG